MSLKATEVELESTLLSAGHEEPACDGPSTVALPPVAEPSAPSSPFVPAAGNFGEVLRHELNNPLTGILGNVELLLVELRRQNIELPSTARQRIEIIASLSVRMRERVRTLSDRWESESAQAHPAKDSAPLSLFH